VSGPTKTRREPWHAAKPDRLPRERRVEEAMEILGKGVLQRSDVELVLDRMEKESEKWRDIRSLESGSLKTSAKKRGAALDKVIDLMEEAPAALRTPLGIGYIGPELGIGEPLVDKRGNLMFEGEVFPSMNELLRHLRVVRRHYRSYESSKVSQKQKKAAADDKRVAAWGALKLCEMHGIRPTKTKNGRFCRLAAALYGHPSANFLPHCQGVLKEREARQKIADEVRDGWAQVPAEVREVWQKVADGVREGLSIREAGQKAADEVRERLAKIPPKTRES
jgi:hypothetical protein